MQYDHTEQSKSSNNLLFFFSFSTFFGLGFSRRKDDHWGGDDKVKSGSSQDIYHALYSFEPNMGDKHLLDCNRCLHLQGCVWHQLTCPFTPDSYAICDSTIASSFNRHLTVYN